MLRLVLALNFLVSGLLALESCGANETYTDCDPRCGKSCDNLAEDVHCPCRPGCACIEDYVYESTEKLKCIHQRDCYSYCGPNKVYLNDSQCSRASCATCHSLENECDEPCVAQCYCADGFLENEVTGHCLDPQDCL